MLLDCFSGSLGQLPKSKRTAQDALRVLADDPRVSTFERGPLWLENLLQALEGDGLIVELDEPYPWHKFRLTDAGRQALAGSKTPNAKLTGDQRP